MGGKRINKTQEKKEINKKKTCYACESGNHEIKECDPQKNIFISDRVNRQRNKKLQYRLEEYGKIKCIKIRQNE